MTGGDGEPVAVAPLLHVAFHDPQIPQNTGTMARLCAAQRVPLHIVGRPAFRLNDKAVRRAGLDYWPEVDLRRHGTVEALRESLLKDAPGGQPPRILLFTTKASRPYGSFDFRPGDCLLFGSETRGLPEEMLAADPAHCLTIPMANPAIRSLNLAVSAAMALGEALRQIQPSAWQWDRSRAPLSLRSQHGAGNPGPREEIGE